MTIADLGRHIHDERNKINGQQPGKRLRWGELCDVAEGCPRNGISKVRLYTDQSLPDPVMGVFVRIRVKDGSEEALIYTASGLGPGWREFVICKEVMHCWSSPGSHNGTSASADNLIEELINRPDAIASSAVISDQLAVIAAANAVLPRETIIGRNARGEELMQIATSEDLPFQIVKLLASPDIGELMKTRSL